MVIRSLAIPKRLRTYDVSDAISSKQNGASQLFLRIASHVAGHHSEGHAEAQALEITKPECDQTAPFVAIG